MNGKKHKPVKEWYKQSSSPIRGERIFCDLIGFASLAG